MPRTFRVAFVALALVGCALSFAGGYQAHTVVRTAAPLSLTDRAAVALQASYNTQQIGLGIPLRIVGAVTCHATKQFSPTAASMVCAVHAVGPHTAAVGGCAQVVGVYYDKLAGFAQSTYVNEPCPE